MACNNYQGLDFWKLNSKVIPGFVCDRLYHVSQTAIHNFAYTNIFICSNFSNYHLKFLIRSGKGRQPLINVNIVKKWTEESSFYNCVYSPPLVWCKLPFTTPAPRNADPPRRGPVRECGVYGGPDAGALLWWREHDHASVHGTGNNGPLQKTIPSPAAAAAAAASGAHGGGPQTRVSAGAMATSIFVTCVLLLLAWMVNGVKCVTWVSGLRGWSPMSAEQGALMPDLFPTWSRVSKRAISKAFPIILLRPLYWTLGVGISWYLTI